MSKIRNGSSNESALIQLDRARESYAPRLQERPTASGPRLELTIELDYGREAESWAGHIPSTLLIDNQDRLYLERWARPFSLQLSIQAQYREDYDTFTMNDGSHKRLDEIVEGDLTPVSPKAALEWYASVDEFASGADGGLANLCRIAAKALGED